jgi:lipopolysaccharide export system protein LptC
MARLNRYSRLVNALKLVLPLGALGLLSTLFLLADVPDPERAIPYAEVDVAQLARELRLTQPRFAGVLADGREITLVAETAAPDFDATEVILTDALEGRIALDAERFLYVDAGAGRIDVAGRVADLSDGVEVEVTDGYTVTSDTMRLRLAELGVAAPGDVRVTGPDLVLTAGAMDLGGAPGAAVLSFTGGVRLIYDPQE